MTGWRDPGLAFLGRDWESLEADASAFVTAAESSIQDWGWLPWGTSLISPYLLSAETHGSLPQERRLKDPPGEWQDALLCGWAGDGHLLLVRAFSFTGRPQVLNWQDMVWLTGRGGQRILVKLGETATRAAPRSLSVHVQVHQDGRLERVESYLRDLDGEPQRRDERYTYDESGLLTTIHGEDRNGPHTISVGYGADGALAVLTLHRDGDEPMVLFRRKPSGAVRSAARLLEKKLPEQIIAWAQRQATTEPPYALIIAYDAGSPWSLPPALALGTVSELRRFVAEETEADALADRMWNPAELSCFDVEPGELSNDSDLREANEVLRTHWASTDDVASVRQLLVKVGKRVGESPWITDRSEHSPVAVLAIDLELEDLGRNLRAMVPTATQHALMRPATG